MTRTEERAAALAEAAREDQPSVLELAQELVRIPSRGGIDPYDPVLDCMASWLGRRGLQCRRLAGPGGATVALASEVTGTGAGPRYVLDACLDTAPFGDESAWKQPPTSGEVSGGWLHGRGSSDSKAAALVTRLHGIELPGPAGPEFPLPARLTVTAISGGEGYSVVPDLCAVNVDVRLTPVFDSRAALAVIRGAATATDDSWPGTQPTYAEVTTSWPPYALPEDAPLRLALMSAARSAGINTGAKVAGPSNIGNYLAGLGIPATAGFGVVYQGLHGTDERIRVDSIPPVQAAYHQALLTLLPPA
jgi:acetylornithine deacetylase/succinyl-diaminopimelate desuccinylase-like protein